MNPGTNNAIHPVSVSAFPATLGEWLGAPQTGFPFITHITDLRHKQTFTLTFMQFRATNCYCCVFGLLEEAGTRKL